MAFNVPMSGLPDEAGIKEQLQKEIVKGMGVDQSLMDWAESTDKDDFEAKLMQIRPQDWQKFLNEEARRYQRLLEGKPKA